MARINKKVDVGEIIGFLGQRIIAVERNGMFFRFCDKEKAKHLIDEWFELTGEQLEIMKVIKRGNKNYVNKRRS